MNPFCSSMVPGAMTSGMGTKGSSPSVLGRIMDMLPQGAASKAGMSTPGQPTQQPQQPSKNYADPTAVNWYQQNNGAPSSGGPGMAAPGQQSRNYATPAAQSWYQQSPFSPAGG